MIRALLLGVALMAVAAPAQARILELRLPLDCAIGEGCFIQNYVDHDAAADAAQDYTCGHQTYDGHDGTDFRVRNYAELEAGVPVLAAAEGTVTHLHITPEFEEDDIPLLRLIKLGMHRSCGTGLHIDHGKGWESVYCHLDWQDIRVEDGQRVQAGDVLGMMGTSGNTTFPHVHYELRHHGRAIDPFAGYAPYDCNTATPPRYSLWEESLRKALPYRPAGVVQAGFSHQPPSLKRISAGKGRIAQVLPDADTLYFWVELYGLRQYDRLILRLHGPDGHLLEEASWDYAQPYAQVVETLAYRPDKGMWQGGEYRVRLLLERYEHVLKQTLLDREWRIGNAEKNPNQE